MAALLRSVNDAPDKRFAIAEEARPKETACGTKKVAPSFCDIETYELRRDKEVCMSVDRSFWKTGRGLAAAAGILAAIGLTTMPRPANAGGIGPGAAVGIGLGAFALGSALSHPYSYNPYYYNSYNYPYGYYGYYPTAPAYYPAAPDNSPRRCWSPYYNNYYAC